MPITTVTSPITSQTVEPVMKLPPTTPNPCRVHSRADQHQQRRRRSARPTCPILALFRCLLAVACGDGERWRLAPSVSRLGAPGGAFAERRTCRDGSPTWSPPWCARCAVSCCCARLRRLPSCMAAHPGHGDRVPVLDQLGRELLGLRQRRRPGIAAAEEVRGGRHREVGRGHVREIGPGHRERHRQPGPDPRAVGGDDRRADRSGGVEEDLAGAVGADERRGRDLRVERLRAGGQGAGRRGGVHDRNRGDRHEHVDALAAAGLHRADQSQVVQHPADQHRRADDVRRSRHPPAGRGPAPGAWRAAPRPGSARGGTRRRAGSPATAACGGRRTAGRRPRGATPRPTPSSGRSSRARTSAGSSA